MTDNTQPETREFTMSQYASKDDMIAAMHARIAEMETQLEAIGAGGVSGPLVKGFSAADMATASAQGFRDGAASVAANAGSEPVARVNDDGFIVEIGELLIAPGTKLYTHPYPLGGMVGGCNGGSND